MKIKANRFFLWQAVLLIVIVFLILFGIYLL